LWISVSCEASVADEPLEHGIDTRLEGGLVMRRQA
jgi:hypothetical protein